MKILTFLTLTNKKNLARIFGIIPGGNFVQKIFILSRIYPKYFLCTGFDKQHPTIPNTSGKTDLGLRMGSHCAYVGPDRGTHL